MADLQLKNHALNDVLIWKPIAMFVPFLFKEANGSSATCILIRLVELIFLVQLFLKEIIQSISSEMCSLTSAHTRSGQSYPISGFSVQLVELPTIVFCRLILD